MPCNNVIRSDEVVTVYFRGIKAKLAEGRQNPGGVALRTPDEHIQIACKARMAVERQCVRAYQEIFNAVRV